MANLIQLNPAAKITWLASGGSRLLTLTSVGAAAGRQGQLYDFTLAARPRDFNWRLWLKFATTPVVGQLVRVYWKTSDGTNPDNDDGTGDAAVSAIDKLANLTYLGALKVDEASTTPTFVKSGFLPKEICSPQWGAPVIWNAAADDLSSTAADHGFHLEPVDDEIQ